MDGFTYTNIFDTKGIEYLIIIAFLILVIPFWMSLNKPLRIKERIKEALGVLSEKILKIPQGLFYSKNHTWTHLEKSGNARVGLDDLLVHLTGQVELSGFMNPGDRVNKGDLLTQITQDGKYLKISSPISGEIMSANTSLEEHSETLSKDPYGKGWLYEIKPEKWLEETNNYYLSEDATNWSAKELSRFKDFISFSMKKHSPETSMIIMQEGGELKDNPLSGMPDEVWMDFQKSFLEQEG